MIEEILRRIEISGRYRNIKGVYLGYKEMRELLSDERIRGCSRMVNGKFRHYLDGIPVYEVDEENHFNVG